MKFSQYCSEGRIVDVDCKKRGLGCEFDCPVGGGLIDTALMKEEERIFGDGYRQVVKDLRAKGFSQIPGGGEFYGYFQNGEGQIYAPDYQGGFFKKNDLENQADVTK